MGERHIRFISVLVKIRRKMGADFLESKRYLRHLRTFGKRLIDNIKLGDDKKEEAKKQLKSFLEDENLRQHWLRKLGSLTDSNNDTILHLAMIIYQDTSVMDAILKICPDLILRTRRGQFEGQTVLHMAISKHNSEALKKLLEMETLSKYKGRLLRTLATGSRFMGTVMMGELPFSVAALTLDTEILEIMFENQTDDMTKLQNSFGDTVFHSLIKYSCYHPSKEEQIIEICKFIDERLEQNDSAEGRAIWLLANYNNQTPLQLSASLEQVKIFEFILNIENVYCRFDLHDGLFDVHLVDISEIDTVTSLKDMRKTTKPSKVSPFVVPDIELPQEKINDHTTRYTHPDNPLKSKPILETICEISVTKAFRLLTMNVVSTMINKKWNRYKYLYFFWTVVHLLYMVLLTLNAVYKTELLKDFITQGAETMAAEDHTLETYFVLVMNILNIAVGIVIISTEIWRRCFQGHRFHLKQLHHNGSYRVMLLTFAISLIVDSIWYLADPSNNFFLIASLLIGWWFLTFFLRAHKKFSFFTVMLQRILLGDVLRFAVIILIEFLSFTVAMYLNFLYTKPEGFRTIGESFMTLFNLMFGLTELSILEEARDPWLANVLYILFVIVTYVIIVNSLIAMMSQTCATMSDNKVEQGSLQRLSVILFLEQVLPNVVKVKCGNTIGVRMMNSKTGKTVREKRYLLEISSLQTKSADIMKRQKMIRKTDTVDRATAVEMLPIEAQKPSPIEAQKPSPIEAQKPSPIETQKPSPIEAQKRVPEERRQIPQIDIME